ncbi:hypothetical protein K2173_026346 [Erythroxylum novogranatense]|uniref:Membrane-associated kinase regulator 5 n=1 Tax=Erythroxylum novogranatense TaxID=1862640 RepID=A0AAV8SN43_9ROSI|nr:hypothetical protein K2173_026346 [Erythroxylum novogranatense]
MCSETSPRISFSIYLCPEDYLPANRESRRDTKLVDSSSDFEFSICSKLDHEPSLADELFADGMILPHQIHETAIGSDKQMNRGEPQKKASFPPIPGHFTSEKPKKEVMVLNSKQLEEKPQSRSFWGFKRSTSLNCDIKRSLICSLPLLSRSNSTGSEPNPKKISMKDGQKHTSQKQHLKPASSSSYLYVIAQKRPLKNNYGGCHGNGIKINHLLNVPSPYMSKGTVSFLGFGSFLRSGKEKKNKK